MSKVSSTNKLTALVVGEVGMGKSTLVWNLECNKKKAKIDGEAAEGVTKDFVPYNYCNLDGVRGQSIVMDSPGVGDEDVPVFQWIGMAEGACKMVDVILVCCNENHPRLTLGAKVVSMLIKQGIVKHNDPKRLEQSIILITTMGHVKKDLSDKAAKGIESVKKKLAEKCGLKSIAMVRVPAKSVGEGTPVLDLTALQKHVAKVKKSFSSEKSLQYKPPSAETLINCYQVLSGIPMSKKQIKQAEEELGFWRNLVEGLGNLFILNPSVAGKKITKALGSAAATFMGWFGY